MHPYRVRPSSATRRKRLLQIQPLEDRTVPSGNPLVDPIYAPGTSQEYIDKHHDDIHHSDGGNTTAFQAAAKWSTTATNGPVGTREAVVLTWGIVPDGMALPAVLTGESSSSSSLRAFMDGLYGAGPGGSDLTLRPWFSLFQNSLLRNAAVSGLTYVYLAADDSAAFNSSAGSPGVRPDVRIGGHPIDGSSGILAYNYFPNGGDMVIDTNDGSFIGSTTNTSRAFRNILMHEQGHGVGLAHEEPVDGNTLMEPFLNTSFDGPQFDDVMGLHRLYGDVNEKTTANATTVTATAIGNLAIGTPIIRGASGNTASELTGATATDFVSIDDDGDIDVYSFTVNPNALITAVVTPVGPTYQSAPQNGTAVTFVSSQQSDLTLEFLNSGGTVIASANTGGLGAAETIAGIYSGFSGGSFFVRVTGAENKAQMYQLQLSAVSAGSTVAVVSGNLQAIGSTANNLFSVVRSGTNYRVTDPVGAIAGPGASQFNTTTVDVPIASISGIIDIRGNDGTDSISLDLSGGNIVPAGGILFSGGNGTDTVIGPGVAGAWSLTTAGAGTLTASGASTLTFNGMENLTGSSLDDGFTFAGGSLAGAIDGGVGTDNMTGDGTGRSFSISGANSGSVVIVSSTTFTNIENLTGGSAADSFAFTSSGSLTGTVNGGGGTDSLTGTDAGLTFTLNGADAGNVATILTGFVSVETLVGGTGADSLIVQLGGSLTGSFNASSGTDSVNLSALASQNLTVSALGSTDGFNLAGSSIAGGLLNVNSLIGTSNPDSLTGRNANSTWTISAANAGTHVDVGTSRSLAITSVEGLSGGSAIDTFQFSTGGSLSGAIVGGGGTDLIIGDNTSRTFTVTGSDSGVLGTILTAGFSSVENLQGGTAGDAFVFGAAGVLTGTINGGNGSDTITGDDSSLAYSITGANAGNISTLLAAGFMNVENLRGGAAADSFTFGASGSLVGTIQGGGGIDTLFGNNTGLTFLILGLDAGSIVSALAIGFSEIENVTAGTGNDTFQMDGGSLFGTLGGGAGVDTFQLNAGTFSGTLDGGADQDAFFLNGGSLTGLLDGGPGDDSLAGNNVGQTFAISGSNAGSVPGQVFAFASVETLLGGTGPDVFNFGASGLLAGSINGGAGTDVLSGTDAGHAFTINAGNGGTASTILVNGFVGIEDLQGGTGADTFTFGASGSLSGTVQGGGGVNSLFGKNANSAYMITGSDAGSIASVLAAGFSEIENVTGGTANDTFTLSGFSLSGTLAGGAGTDLFQLNAGSLTGLLLGGAGDDTVQLNGGTFSGTLDGGANQDAFFLNGGSLAGFLDGGTENDSLTGNNVGQAFDITGTNAGAVAGQVSSFVNVETLKGGTGPDAFNFGSAGVLNGTIDGGAGSDSLSGTDAGRTFTMNASNGGTVSTILANGFVGIENLAGGIGNDAFQFTTPGSLTGSIQGGAGSDTVIGDNSARTFAITGMNAGTIGSILAAGFSNVEIVQGGSAADSFTFGSGSSLSGSVSGGEGNDTLNGDSVGRTYSLAGANAGTVVGLSAFSAIENLIAGSGSDTLVRLPAGSLSGSFDGRNGSDTANLSALPTTQAVFLTGSNHEGFSASLAGLGLAKGLNHIVAPSTTTDLVTGLGTESAWQVRAGTNQTYYRRTSTGDTLYLTGFEQMFGNAGTDAYNVDFSVGVPIGTAGLTLNGGGGSDRIHIVGTAGADSFSIVVGTLAVNGRTIKHSGVEHIAVRGGNGSDTFVAGIGLPVGFGLLELFGDAGNDFAKVAPSTNTRIVFNGGTGSDRLRVDTLLSGAPLFDPPAGIWSGTYFFAIHRPIEFLSVETREFGPVP